MEIALVASEGDMDADMLAEDEDGSTSEDFVGCIMLSVEVRDGGMLDEGEGEVDLIDEEDVRLSVAV